MKKATTHGPAPRSGQNNGRQRRESVSAILRAAYKRNVRDSLTRTAVKACLGGNG